MPDVRAKRRRQLRRDQQAAADLEKVSGLAVKTHMVTGAAIGGVAALVLANMLWPVDSYVFTPKEMAMTLGGSVLGSFIMGCRKILSNLESDAPAEAHAGLRRANFMGTAGGAAAGVALGVVAFVFADRPMQIVAGLAAITVWPFAGYVVWPMVLLIVDLIRHSGSHEEG